VTDGQFDLVLMFQKMGIDEMFGGLPLFFFPYINITAMWVFAPIAALCARKNPAVGLSFYGFMAVNALTHIGSTAVLGGDILANPGNVTGIFLFVPLAIWVYHVCVRGSFMDGRGLAACILGGVLGHMLLFSIYIVNLMLGHLAAALWVVADMGLLASLQSLPLQNAETHDRMVARRTACRCNQNGRSTQVAFPAASL